MKNLFSCYLKRKWILIVTLLFSFCLGFFIANTYNYYNSYYQCDFNVENISTFDINKLNDVNFLNEIKASGYNETTKVNKYENINVEKILKNKDFEVTVNEDNSITIKTPYKYYDVFFVLSSQKMSNRAKTFIRDALTKLAIDNEVTYKYGSDIVVVKNDISKTITGLVTMLIGLISALSIITILYFKKEENNNPFIYDNENTYHTIFHKKYWLDAFKAVKKTRDITLISLIFALMMVCKLIPLPSGFGDLGLSFTFLFMALIGIIYGPVIGFLIGVLSDTLGFFINSSGYFFLGYTLQAALTGMIYGLFFYKTKINFSKVFLCRLLVNMLMNVVLGSICYAMVFTDFSWFGKDFNKFVTTYITLLSLPKNIVYLLPQSLFLFYFIKLTSPILYTNNLMNKQVYIHIKVFK